MSHSKRNTAASFFTSYERELLKSTWGSQKQRLSRDSFMPFGNCQLCLMTAVNPVACPKGDIFCRECALANLLTQRQEIKRLEAEMERRQQDELERELREDEEAKSRIVKEFEMIQDGFEVPTIEARDVTRREQRKASTAQQLPAVDGSKSGVKRKFEIDEDELRRIAHEETRKARKDLENEKKAAEKHVPSFWVPTETPEVKEQEQERERRKDKRPKLRTLCPSSDEAAPHAYSMKSLIAVNFQMEANSSDRSKKSPACPACLKTLNNASKPVITVPCGHVLCRHCTRKFMTPIRNPDPHNPEHEHSVLRCYVCSRNLTEDDTDAKDRNGGENGDVKGTEAKKRKKKQKHKDRDEVPRPGLVDLHCEGTGFAAGGKNVAEKKGIAFQC